jgi:preprotein translocase subunit SecG
LPQTAAERLEFSRCTRRLLGNYLDSLTRTSLQSTTVFGGHMELLSGEIHSFSDRADGATRYLTHWTAVLAAVTLVLAIATGALVWVEFKKGEAPHIVTTPSASKP